MNTFPFTVLLSWYQKNGRHDLPWRNYDFDEKQLGYRVWLSEIMLQQTQVERVKEYFLNILKAFPTIEDLAICDYETFYPYYKWLGYYSRARNMLACSKKVVEEYNGFFPKETQDLVKLPWVWPYTAEAIRAFAYDEMTLSFDTNLEKIFSRYYHGNKFQKLTKEEKENILEDFQKSGISWRHINNSLMDFWALISLNNVSAIYWKKYPFHDCEFYKTQGYLEPVKQKRNSSFPSKEAQIFAILHENHKVYFSQKATFLPFHIWKNTWNPRAMIQEFFRETYSLELSVRPPEVKSYSADETPYMIYYCQVQSGNHDFMGHEWIKVRGFEEGLVEEFYL